MASFGGSENSSPLTLQGTLESVLFPALPLLSLSSPPNVAGRGPLPGPETGLLSSTRK